MLYRIVSISILGQSADILQDLIHYNTLYLVLFAVLQHSLNIRQPYVWEDSATTCPKKAKIMKCILSWEIHSIHFWITWFPFWSSTQRITCPSNSWTSFNYWSVSTTSTAFWMTLQPYICRLTPFNFSGSWENLSIAGHFMSFDFSYSLHLWCFLQRHSS